MDHTMFLVFALLSAIALVVFLIMKVHIQAFVSLLITCIYVGLITGIPVFFQVGFVLLIPLLLSVARATGMSSATRFRFIDISPRKGIESQLSVPFLSVHGII